MAKEYYVQYKASDGRWYGIGDPRECSIESAYDYYARIMNERNHTEKTLRLLSRAVGEWNVERGEADNDVCRGDKTT